MPVVIVLLKYEKLYMYILHVPQENDSSIPVTPRRYHTFCQT